MFSLSQKLSINTLSFRKPPPNSFQPIKQPIIPVYRVCLPKYQITQFPVIQTRFKSKRKKSVDTGFIPEDEEDAAELKASKDNMRFASFDDEDRALGSSSLEEEEEEAEMSRTRTRLTPEQKKALKAEADARRAKSDKKLEKIFDKETLEKPPEIASKWIF
jgi:hypothetical protein